MQNDSKLLRYSRQIILNEVGIEGQQKLSKSKVLVIGAGGLGSPALYYLASAGIGTIGIVDFDVVGISNLQRQIIHFTGDLGKRKVDSAAEKLKALNPEICISSRHLRINEDNIEEIIKEYDVVLDSTDNIPARYLISDCCFLLGKPLVEAAVTGFIGTIFTIIPGKSPCYRCLYPEPPANGVVPSCSETGIIGMVAGTIGSLQALEALKLILGIGDTISGRVLYFDGLNSSFNNINVERSESCPLCSPNQTIKELVNYEIQCKIKSVTEI